MFSFFVPSPFPSIFFPSRCHLFLFSFRFRFVLLIFSFRFDFVFLSFRFSPRRRLVFVLVYACVSGVSSLVFCVWPLLVGVSCLVLRVCCYVKVEFFWRRARPGGIHWVTLVVPSVPLSFRGLSLAVGVSPEERCAFRGWLCCLLGLSCCCGWLVGGLVCVVSGIPLLCLSIGVSSGLCFSTISFVGIWVINVTL